MGYYHTAQICLNGHMINDTFDTHKGRNKSFCPKCGSKTITTCPSCNSTIHGEYDCGVVVLCSTSRVDAYCYNCGKPYPWTQSAFDATAIMNQEEENISDLQKAFLVESLPDIISETPKTNLAISRFKKCLTSAGRFTADAIKQFVIDFGCELAKKSLGL